MKLRWFFLFSAASSFLALSSYAFGADSPELRAELAGSRSWLKMLHYQPRTWGGLRSRMPDGEFFFASDGRSNPLSELNATVAAFSRNDLQVGKLRLHPQCAFPLRFKWLREKLQLPIEPVDCAKLREFTDSFAARTVSLAFSTAYPNNPGSMFGHTFLKFNSGTRSELLDQAISYAANIAGDGGIIYMVRGVFGGYKGVFSRTPYYVKVNEYNHSESRDLWEYELGLTPEETADLVLHLWELEINSSFDYFFFDENCAFILLAAIEAVKPDWDFGLRHSYFVIPGETVKSVAEMPEAIRKSQFRPSLRKKFFQAVGALKPDERDVLQSLAEFRVAPSEVRNATVLDVASLYFQYVKQRDGNDTAAEVLEKQKEVLRMRSTLRGEKGLSERELPPLDLRNDPLAGHGPKHLTLGFGGGDGGRFEELGFKFAYHDLMDRDAGYERFSHFEFPYLTMRRYDRDRSFRIETVNAVAVTSLFPWTVLERRWSWRFLLDYRALKDLACDSCHAVHVEATPGVTFAMGDRLLATALAGLEVERSEAFSSGWRETAKAEFALLADPVPQFKLKLAAAPFVDLFQSDRALWGVVNEAAVSWASGPDLAVQTQARSWLRAADDSGKPGFSNRELALRVIAYF